MNGTLTQAYQPYGKPLTSDGSGTSPYGYAGEWTDGSGLQYLRARYYAPGQGRFITKDAWAGDVMRPMSYNGWVYGYGNPVRYADPSGLCVQCQIGHKVIVNGVAGPVPVYSEPNGNSPLVGYLYDNEVADVLGARSGNVLTGFREVRVLRSGTSNPLLPPEDQGGSYMRTGFVLDQFLLDNCPIGLGVFSCIPTSSFPIQQGNYTRKSFGFGPNSFAKQQCPQEAGFITNWQGEQIAVGFGTGACPYNSTRGLHNGLDFPALSEDYVIWPGASNGTIRCVPSCGDGDPSIRINYSGLDIVIGHVKALPTLKTGDTVRPGQLLGQVAGDHHHFGVRMGQKYFNPLYFFSPHLQQKITSNIHPYPDGYNPYSMSWFDTSRTTANFWASCNNRNIDIGWLTP